MDTSNWRPTQGGSGAGGDSSMESGDWRAQLQADSRQRIVNNIMDTLKRHLPFSGQEGLLELKKIAVRCEEKIYTAATSESDYLRKISLKMLAIENRSQNPIPDPQLQEDSRQRIVNKITDTLKRLLPYSGDEGLQELKQIAVRFEEKIYTAATSQSDYLQMISLKMLTMETRSQNPMPNTMLPNSAGNSVNLSDPDPGHGNHPSVSI